MAVRLGSSLLGLVADSDRVILVDAVRTDDRREHWSGSMVQMSWMAVRDRLSPHQVGVADLLDAARLIDSYPTAVTLLGLVPDSIELAVVRSSAVDGGLDELVAAIVREVESLGYRMVYEPEASGRNRPINDLTRHFGM